MRRVNFRKLRDLLEALPLPSFSILYCDFSVLRKQSCAKFRYNGSNSSNRLRSLPQTKIFEVHDFPRTSGTPPAFAARVPLLLTPGLGGGGSSGNWVLGNPLVD